MKVARIPVHFALVPEQWHACRSNLDQELITLSDLPTSPIAPHRVWTKAGLPWSSDRPVSQESWEVIRL